jgi:repressor LexA
MLHPIQEEILKLSKKENLTELTLREIGKKIRMKSGSPQKVKHHLLQLQKKGFLNINKTKGMIGHSITGPDWAKGLLKSKNRLFSIPIIGTANCGPATIFAEENFQGFLKVSNKLLGRSSPDGLYAIKADGSSMNKAEINGKKLEDGDFVIVDNKIKNIEDREVALIIIDDVATIKRIIKDEENDQIVLKADSSFDYDPIYLHKDDKFVVNGKVIDIIKNPN